MANEPRRRDVLRVSGIVALGGTAGCLDGVVEELPEAENDSADGDEARPADDGATETPEDGDESDGNESDDADPPGGTDDEDDGLGEDNGTDDETPAVDDSETDATGEDNGTDGVSDRNETDATEDEAGERDDGETSRGETEGDDSDGNESDESVEDDGADGSGGGDGNETDDEGDDTGDEAGEADEADEDDDDDEDDEAGEDDEDETGEGEGSDDSSDGAEEGVPPDEPPEGFVTYTNEGLGYALVRPEGWEVEESGEEVYVGDPESGRELGVLTLDAAAFDSSEALAAEFLAGLEADYEDVEVREEGDRTLESGQDARLLDVGYDNPDDDRGRRRSRLVFVIDPETDTGYVVEVAASAEAFDASFEDRADTMLGSFRIESGSAVDRVGGFVSVPLVSALAGSGWFGVDRGLRPIRRVRSPRNRRRVRPRRRPSPRPSSRRP